MTCVVGLVEGDRVWMGGDSAATENTALVVQANAKVFRNGPFLIGCAGSNRLRDVMRFTFDAPKHPRRMDTYRYVVTHFADAARDALRKSGSLHRLSEIETLPDGAVLLGYRGRLFHLDEDFQVGEAVDDFYAIGCGDSIAQGAMFVSHGVPARKRILAALGAAERYNAGVRRPFMVQVLSGDQK